MFEKKTGLGWYLPNISQGHGDLLLESIQGRPCRIAITILHDVPEFLDRIELGAVGR